MSTDRCDFFELSMLRAHLTAVIQYLNFHLHSTIDIVETRPDHWDRSQRDRDNFEPRDGKWHGEALVDRLAKGSFDGRDPGQGFAGVRDGIRIVRRRGFREVDDGSEVLAFELLFRNKDGTQDGAGEIQFPMKGEIGASEPNLCMPDQIFRRPREFIKCGRVRGMSEIQCILKAYEEFDLELIFCGRGRNRIGGESGRRFQVFRNHRFHTILSAVNLRGLDW